MSVRGNQLSKSNHGYVCPRGHLIPQQVYDPDRIKLPMKRTNPAKGRGVDPKWFVDQLGRGDGHRRRQDVRAAADNEAHKFSYIRGRYSDSNDFLYDSMPKIFGSANNFSHSSICAEAEKCGRV